MPFQLKPLDVIRLYCLIIVNHILTEQHVSEGAVQSVDNGKISDLAILTGPMKMFYVTTRNMRPNSYIWEHFLT